MSIQLANNGVLESSVGAITLSGFGATMNSDTVDRVFTGLGDKGIAAYTFEKPGSFNLPGTTFSFESLTEKVREAIELISEKHDRIILMPNSMTSIPFLRIAQELRDTLEGLLFIAPVFNPEGAVLNELKTKGHTAFQLQSELLRNVGLAMETNVDAETVMREMEEYKDPTSVIELLKGIETKVKFYMNQGDRIIDPHLVKTISNATGCEIISTSSIPGNETHHAVPVDEILPNIQAVRIAA